MLTQRTFLRDGTKGTLSKHFVMHVVTPLEAPPCGDALPNYSEQVINPQDGADLENNFRRGVQSWSKLIADSAMLDKQQCMQRS